MKVSTVKPEFQPVVVTLETQEEVDQMFQLANFNTFKGEFDITRSLYDSLENLVSYYQYLQSDDYSYLYKVVK